ncbi:MAG: MBL fold metallo-hydrolase [Candidatus Aenigmatarchaeota archaeon]
MKVFEIKNIKIEWLGHASFRVRNNLVIYFDPYILDENPIKADVIFVSHDHFDHKDDGNIKKISREDTIVIGPRSVTKDYKNSITVKPYDELEIKGIKVKAFPAYNPKKPFHPKEKGYVGFIVEIDSLKIYHPGDTELIEEMKELSKEKIDVALLPIGGTYVMDVEQALKAIEYIQPKYVIPMHYGKWRDIELKADVEKFKKEAKVEVIVLEGLGKK